MEIKIKIEKYAERIYVCCVIHLERFAMQPFSSSLQNTIIELAASSEGEVFGVFDWINYLRGKLWKLPVKIEWHWRAA